MFEPILQSEPVYRRLWREAQFTAQELRHNPRAFLRELLKQEKEKEVQRRFWLGSAVAIVTYGAIIAILIALSIHQVYVVQKPDSPDQEIVMIDPSQFPPPAASSGGQGGGGGGGAQSTKPASGGQLPPAAPQAPLVAPKVVPPIKNPSLPVVPTLQIDPSQVPATVPDINIGLPTAPPGPPSPGKGEGQGIGNGKGTGVGDGEGRGTGPGSGASLGNNRGSSGEGGTGIGGTSTGPGGGQVDTRPRVTFRPPPRYTEEALRNKITGQVVIYVLCRADGTVANARVMESLGHGLDEEAIKAAYRIRFIPATRNGRPVDWTIALTYPFDLRQ